MEHVPESWRPDFGKKMRPPESWKFSTESASRGQIFRRGRRGDLSPWVTPVTSAATEDSDARRGGQVTLTDVFAAIPGGAPEVHCTRARADRTHRHRAASPADLARGGAHTFLVILAWILSIAAGLGIIVGAVLLMPAVTALVGSFFVDDIALEVERTHYPGEP